MKLSNLTYGRLSLGLGAVALCVIGYIKFHFIFDCGNCVVFWIRFALVAVLAAIILGVKARGHWSGRLGVALALITLYFVFFTSLFAIS